MTCQTDTSVGNGKADTVASGSEWISRRSRISRATALDERGMARGSEAREERGEAREERRGSEAGCEAGVMKLA